MQRSSLRSCEEERLIAKCLESDDDAWEILFHHYHHKLVAISRAVIRGDPEQAEEVAAAVWLRLCDDEFACLRRYDPGTGRFLGYLAHMARKEVQYRRRSSRARDVRERGVARREGVSDDDSSELVVQEFLATLTRQEREFCACELLEQQAGPELSSANKWQLRSRVLKKFRIHFFFRE